MARRKEPVIADTLLDRLLAEIDVKAVFESGGLVDQLKKALVARALNAEMDHHLSSESGSGRGLESRILTSTLARGGASVYRKATRRVYRASAQH